MTSPRGELGFFFGVDSAFALILVGGLTLFFSGGRGEKVSSSRFEGQFGFSPLFSGEGDLLMARAGGGTVTTSRY